MPQDVLVIRPPSVSTETALARLETENASACVLSNAGGHLDRDTAGDARPGHLFATGQRQFDAGIVVAEFPVLYGTDFTLAWLDGVAAALRPEGWLRIEIRNPERNARQGLVTADLIAARCPHWETRVTADGQGLDVRRAEPAPEGQFQSVYPAISDRFEACFEAMDRHGQLVEGDRAERRADATRNYIYQLFGANQKAFVLDRILAQHGRAAPLRVLDLGGGFGFLGAELAYRGHGVTVADYDPGKTEGVGPWAMAQCGLEDRVGFETLRMEDVPRLDGKYDVVSFFGALLYAERTAVPRILQHCNELLAPGGLLVIHENPKDVSKPGTVDHDKKFESGELHGLMADAVAAPAYYNMFSGMPIAFEQAARSVLMAAARKPGSTS